MESDEILTSSRAQRVGQEMEKSKTKKKKEIIRQVSHDGFFFLITSRLRSWECVAVNLSFHNTSHGQACIF